MNEQQLEWTKKNMNCCPVANTFSIVGKKFTFLILRNMLNFNQTRFNQFIDSIEGINPKTLSIRLRKMGQDGLMERKIYPETPIRIEYHLTKKGEALRPILKEMADFSMLYCCRDVFKDGKPRTFQDVFGRSMKVPP